MKRMLNTSINAFASANKIYLLADNDNASGEKLLRGEKLKTYLIIKNISNTRTQMLLK